MPPLDRMEAALGRELDSLEEEGRRKGVETVTTGLLPAEGDRGPRWRLAGEGDRPFLRMNSNGYLGMALEPEVMAAEERATRAFGAGPQAVRFIAGTFETHVSLERRLADFHGRPSAMAFSSAYAAVMGVLPPLVTGETAVVSDELNHNCIINATRLSQPVEKRVYPHLSMDGLRNALEALTGRCRRVIVVTDGVFSMRGDHAPLDEISAIAEAFDERFAENVVTVVDDSHGVGALGTSGRGTEEMTGGSADLLVATLGKALGTNGGYVTGPERTIEWLRETSPFYVYSNPITPGEAAAAERAVELLAGARGQELLARLRAVTVRFRRGLEALGYESIAGEHPVVPVLVRDSARTRALVRHLHEHGVLATGLAYPVVPRGEEEIRFQLSALHTEADVDEALAALESFLQR